MLLRKKSVDLKNAKKAQALREEQERKRQARPPKLPEFTNNAGQLSTTLSQELQQSDSGYSMASYSLSASGSGGLYTEATAQPRSYATNSSPPVPPIPEGMFDPYARTESMTHRGRHSYASSAVSTINSPRRIRRRKDPTPFK